MILIIMHKARGKIKVIFMAKKDYSSWTKDELIKEIEKKKYGVVWEDKPESLVQLCKEKLPILIEEKKKEIKLDGDDLANILIEGDNYHSLSVLNYTHSGSVDVIFIDPPYNTGKKDFTYNDNYVEEDDPYRHSKWLSFMGRRLYLAKNLLKRTGIIFITISDTEVAQLKLLCDEVFGETNFVADFIWNSTKSITNPALISVSHTYILTYAKSKSVFDNSYRKNFKLPPILEGFNNPDNDPRGDWKADPFEAGGIRPNQMYPIKNPNTGEVFYPAKGNCWKNDKEKFEDLVKDNRIVFGKDGKGRPQRKRFIWEAEERGLTPNTWWDDVGTTTNGTMELKSLLGDKLFSNPKPVSLLKKILLLSAKKNAVVLDFFAGSGTTGHAVMELNTEDGGNRRFILCTNNENGICDNVCYPRIKKIIEQLYKEAKGKLNKNKIGHLKYFRTDFVDAKTTDANKKKLVDKSTEMLCLKEDCFDEVKEGNSFRIFTNSFDKLLGIIYDDEGIEPFKKEVKKLNKKFIVYVFSLDDSARDEEFADVADLVDLKPIPAVILNVYKRIFK